MLFGTNKKSEIPAPPDDKPVGILTVLSGPQSGTKVEIRDGETIQIGRNGMACKLALPQGYPTVSRVHCNVLFRADVRRFYVTDVSSNGTWLVTQEFKNRMTKGQVVPLPVGGELWLADEKCRIGMRIREPVMPVTEEPQTSDETLLQLIAQHHADTTPQTFLPILEYLRSDPKLFVPMTAQISAADQAQFLNAKPGDQISTKGQIRMKPDYLTKDGKLFFPVFTSKEETPEQYRNNFSWMQLPFLQCAKMTLANADLSAVVINAFTKNLVLNREALQLLLECGVQDRVLEKGTVVQLEPVGPEGDSVKKAAVRFLRQTAARRAYFAKMTDKGEKSYLFAVDTGNLEPRAFFEKMHAAVMPARPKLPVDYVPYDAVRTQILASDCRMIYQQCGVKDARFALDDRKLAYLRAHLDADGRVGSYSIDIEKANDSHYSFSADEARKLEEWVRKTLGDASLPEALRRMVMDAPFDNENQVESYLAGLLQKLRIDYEEFHF